MDFYNGFIKPNKSLFYTKNSVPTLGSVRGKIVIFRAVSLDTKKFNDNTGSINFSGYPYQPSRNDIVYSYTSMKNSKKITFSHLYVQDNYQLLPDKKWKSVKGFLESKKLYTNNFNVCFTSTAATGCPLYASKVVNKKFLNYDLKHGKSYGIIAFDFADEDVCRKVYMSNLMPNIPATGKAVEDNILGSGSKTAEAYVKSLERLTAFFAGLKR